MAQTLTCPRCNQQYGRTVGCCKRLYPTVAETEAAQAFERRHGFGPVEDASPSGAEVVVSGAL